MADAIKKLCSLKDSLERDYIAEPCWQSITLGPTARSYILAAIRDLEGVASGTHVIVSKGNACDRYPYCGCKGGLSSLVVCHAMLSAVEKKEAQND